MISDISLVLSCILISTSPEYSTFVTVYTRLVNKWDNIVLSGEISESSYVPENC